MELHSPSAGKAEPSLPVAPPSASLDSCSPPSQRGNLSAWDLLESVHLCSRLTRLCVLPCFLLTQGNSSFPCCLNDSHQPFLPGYLFRFQFNRHSLEETP